MSAERFFRRRTEIIVRQIIYASVRSHGIAPRRIGIIPVAVEIHDVELMIALVAEAVYGEAFSA